MSHLTSINQSLNAYKNRKVYFSPLGGNNGDTLIQKGAISYLNSLGIKRIKNPEESEAIVINGGGAMNDFWKSGILAAKKYSENYPDIPLIILPSSYSFTETDFTSIFQSHKAPVFLYARESYSLKILEELSFAPCVHLGLDHDMAFQLKNSEFLRTLSAKASNKYILIVERNDFESTTTPVDKSKVVQKADSFVDSKLVSMLKDPIKEYIRKPLRHSLMRNRDRLNENSLFTKESRKRVLIDYPDFSALPTYSADISSNHFFSFKQFCQLVSDSAVVVTTRLHVAILAAMLNKPTYVKTGSYHKIKGVFEQSLKDKDNCRLIE